MSAGFSVRAAIPALALISACDDLSPEGLRRTPPGTGPAVMFDLEVRPLPEIPAPNDIATFADPTSRTGRRINASLVAPSFLERVAREGIGDLEGWGTFMPITVRFRSERPSQPALDLEKIAARMRRDGHRFEDDPVYVINLKTGVPAMLDMGDGNFPLTVRDRDEYYPNDPRASSWNLLYETEEEGAGLTQADYRPALDRDFDGVLDHPNSLGGAASGIRGVDDILGWYERETDTLVMRPLLPLEESTEYAVVLTDRLTGPRGEPVRSPFPFVHHPAQRAAVEKLRAVLGDPARANYYGDLAGTGLDHVAFAWSFTTAPVVDDMRKLRDGLFGAGPFADLARQFPPEATALRLAGLAGSYADDPPGWESDPKCRRASQRPFIIRADDILPQIGPLASALLGAGFLTEEQTRHLLEAISYVDYIVVGTYPVTYFMGDPDREDPAGRFQLDYRTGKGRVGKDVGHFMLAVPKERGARKQPFPSVVWQHGTTLSDVEVLLRMGYFARSGLATIGFDSPGHGLVLDSGQQTIVRGLMWSYCAAPWVTTMVPGRARDLDADGKPDSGGLLWTAYVHHSRDNIRQTVLDAIQLTRVIRAFDGRAMSDQDFNADGQPDLAGDFDGNGVPDIGVETPIYTAGNSFGAITAAIHGALDPNVTAAGLISGGAGLTDIATRSYGVVDSVIQQLLTPLVIGVPASERKDTRCASGERSVRFVVNDLLNSREMELACLPASALGEDMTVRLLNNTVSERRCARTSAGGRFRVPIPASEGDRLEIQIFPKADVVRSYGTCELTEDAPEPRVVRTFEQAAIVIRPLANPDIQCTDPAGCQQYRDRLYSVGSPLVAPQTGLGLSRQTPDLHKLFILTQAALESADPINYARFYGLEPMLGPGGAMLPPRGLMVANTVGDHFVPNGTGDALARAAGALPFLSPSAAGRYPDYANFATPPALFQQLGGKTPNDVLIDNYVIEGNHRLRRTPAGPACAANYSPSMACPGSASSDPSTCAETLFDPDWHSEGTDRYDAQRLPAPLRLARVASPIKDAATLDMVWQPRIQGAPFTKDLAWTPGPPTLSLVNAFVAPRGQHVWVTSDPCKAFDDATYFTHLLGRFLLTRGTDVYTSSHPTTHLCLAKQTCDFLQ